LLLRRSTVDMTFLVVENGLLIMILKPLLVELILLVELTLYVELMKTPIGWKSKCTARKVKYKVSRIGRIRGKIRSGFFISNLTPSKPTQPE